MNAGISIFNAKLFLGTIKLLNEPDGLTSKDINFIDYDNCAMKILRFHYRDHLESYDFLQLAYRTKLGIITTAMTVDKIKSFYSSHNFVQEKKFPEY